jgi:hypothetical protein
MSTNTKARVTWVKNLALAALIFGVVNTFTGYAEFFSRDGSGCLLPVVVTIDVTTMVLLAFRRETSLAAGILIGIVTSAFLMGCIWFYSIVAMSSGL